MKKTIDYDRLKEQAKNENVSVYMLVKRKINYQQTKDWKNCDKCELRRLPQYQGKQILQCELVGLSLDPYSTVDNKHCCDYFKYLP